MSRLPAPIARLAARYAAYSLRERRLIAAAAILGPLLGGYTLLVEPQFVQAKALRDSIARQQANLSGLRDQVGTLQVQSAADPDAARKQELAAVKLQVEGMAERLKGLQDSLVRPEEMNGFLEQLLVRNGRLRLVSLKTLTPESVLPPPATTDGKPAPARQFDIYRHGVELRLEGGYLDLLAYLDQLEKADRKLLWGPLQLSVDDYPKSVLSVTVYTLGTDKAWLAL